MTAPVCGNPGCSRPAVAQFYLGCVHEHITHAVGCETCTAGARKRKATCWECDRGPQPHKCATRIVTR